MTEIFTKENALRIINSIEGKKIDIRKTIEKRYAQSKERKSRG